jgi:hypothetical protein
MFEKRPFSILAGALLIIPIIGQSVVNELVYDDGEPDGGVLLDSEQIAAVRMSSDSGTWRLKTAGYYLYQGEGKVRIFDDDVGQPGSDLVEGFSILADKGPGWYSVDLEPYNITIEGEFYVGIEGLDPFFNCSIGHDFLEGGNGRAWDYTPGFDWSYDPDVTYFIRAGITDEVGVEEELTSQPIIVLQCYSNSFSRSTAISYSLPQSGRVNISIWDASGRCVRTLIDAKETEGNHSTRWDDTDNRGNLLPTGVYFLKINTNRFTLTRKVVLVR